MTPSLGLVNLLEQLTELRETLTFTSLLRDVIKYTDEQPDKEIHKARSGRILCTGTFVSMELWYKIILPGWMCSPACRLSEFCTCRILMEASLYRQDQSLTPFSELLSSQDNGGAVELHIPSF